MDVRNVEWGKSFLWELSFPPMEGDETHPPEPPPTFQKWFPASSISEPVFNVEAFTVNTPTITFNIPSKFGITELRVDFYDTMYHDVREWLAEWSSYMLGLPENARFLATSDIYHSDGKYFGVRPISECIRPVIVKRFNSTHKFEYTKKYLVCPSGSFISSLNSNSEPLTNSCTFSVLSGVLTASQSKYSV